VALDSTTQAFNLFRVLVCLFNLQKIHMPPRWKTAALIWLGIYPTITLVLFLLGPLIADFPLPLKTLCLTLIVVPIMVWVVLPFLQKLLGKWMMGK
jgi:antibiotic biosynthesis monooxygenase (ABM) superfamily enzyme